MSKRRSQLYSWLREQTDEPLAEHLMSCLPQAPHAGRWLVENMPRGYELELPDRRSSRPIPFFDDGLRLPLATSPTSKASTSA